MLRRLLTKTSAMLLLQSLVSTMNSASAALLWTVVGGCFWGLGPLARKLGVTPRSDAQLRELSALTALAYCLGNIIMPAFDFFTTDAQLRQEVLSNAKWQGALPQLILAGISSSIAGIVAIYSLGRATRHTSCLVALVSNGVYCVLSAVLIILVLHERPHAVDYCAMALLTAGILLIHSSSLSLEAKALSPEKKDDDTDNNHQADYGGVQAGKDPCLDEASLMPYVYAILAGILWSFGILGKRTSAGLLPHDLDRPGSAVTYMTYQLAGLPVVVSYWCYLLAFGNLSLHVTQDWFKAQGTRVLPLGMLSGIGGSLVTYAFALGGNRGALISLIADGIYTLFGSLLLAAVYGECPGVRQIIGGLCILVAVVLPQIPQIT